MGLSDDMIEGNWKWLSNGAAPNFTDWNSGQPDNDHNQDCGQFLQSAYYKWDDVSCTDNNLALCEKR